MFKNKVLFITGGTDSFGYAVMKRFLDTDIKEIHIFNRDEKNRMTCAIHCRTRTQNFTSVMSVAGRI